MFSISIIIILWLFRALDVMLWLYLFTTFSLFHRWILFKNKQITQTNQAWRIVSECLTSTCLLYPLTTYILRLDSKTVIALPDLQLMYCTEAGYLDIGLPIALLSFHSILIQFTHLILFTQFTHLSIHSEYYTPSESGKKVSIDYSY